MIKFIEDKELCIKLKEKGFDEGCIMTFRGQDIQAVCQMDYELQYRKNSDFDSEENYWLACPTYCQVFDWFREKHLIKFIESEQFIPSEYNVWNIKQAGSFKKDGEWTVNEAIEEALKLI